MTKHYKPHDESALPAGNAGLPLVAIVGRPNVGKSTLFNRLARKRLAIVHDESGVTRDRHYADTTGFGTPYALVDTGGYDPEDADPMKAGIARHVKEAVKEADVIVFVTDATTELTSADRAAIKLLRQANKPVFFVANKADGPGKDAEAMELYRLGVDKIFPVSALHGRGMGDLEAAIVNALPEPPPREEIDPDIAKVAIVGKPNAGKSSLLNRLLGEERQLVDDRPGTTRDAIDTLVEKEGKKLVFIDTAGIRRKSKVAKAESTVESISVLHAIRAIERAEVVVVVCDAKDGVAEQDAKILGLAADRNRAMIVALNKSDLLSKEEHKKAEERAREKLSFAPYAPIVHISAKTGRGIGQLLSTIAEARQAFTSRVTTGQLNRFFEQVLDVRPPPTSGGKSPRLYFVTQAETAPPTFICMTNFPDAIHFSYRRFVVNQLRERFGLTATPVRVFYKMKRRRSDVRDPDSTHRRDEKED